MNTTENQFKELLEKILVNKKGLFTLRYIQQRLKVGNKDLMEVLAQWIDILIEQDEIDLINVGKDKNNVIVYMTKSHFEQIMKDSFINADYIVDENSTYTIFTQTTKTQNPNTDMLVKKIEKYFQPLVRFDKGSRNVPIMFNLFKLFVPERLINISNDMMENITSEQIGIQKNRKIKKSVFKAKKVEQHDNNAGEIILTALSYLLLEKGKLILSKSEIEDSRGYKVFFNAPDFSVFMNLVKKVYPFNPFVCDQFISFYPENWLDITRIKNQIIQEDPQSFFQHHFEFLAANEVSTLFKLIKTNHSLNQTKKPTIIEKYDEVKEETKNIAQETNLRKPVQEKENQQKPVEIAKMIKEKILKEKPKGENQKKKKVQTSEPLTFLNEIIHKESGNNQSEENSITKLDVEKEEENDQEHLIDRIHLLNKKEMHHLLMILDSTKINSGYYLHSAKDEVFNSFIKQNNLSELFTISDTKEGYRIKRKYSVEDNQYQILREQIENSILGSFNDLEQSSPEIKELNLSQNIDEKNAESENQKEELIGTSLLDHFLIEDFSESKPEKVVQKNTITTESDEGTFEIDENENASSEPSDLLSIDDHSDEDVNHYFGIADEDVLSPKEPDKMYNEMTGIDNHPENFHSDLFIENNEESAEKPPEKAETTAKQPTSFTENTNQLSGKVISVLTEDQEKWLKIKMLSEVIGFELRDGLAYKPEIAVFDEGFSHLEPIAKSTGATIMNIKEFVNLLGLRDKH